MNIRFWEPHASLANWFLCRLGKPRETATSGVGTGAPPTVRCAECGRTS